MLKYKWTALRDVALKTGFVLTEKERASAFDFLRKTCPASLNRAADVRVVTVGAAHLVFQNRVVMRQLKLRAHFQVALETGVRRSPRIDDLAFVATGRDVQTSGAVTAFAAHFLRVIAGSF